MKTIIMAGGKGTRIQSIAADIPKPLIPICGTPVLERELRSLASQGFNDIIITLSHMGEKIQEYFGDGSSFGLHIAYYFEDTPLGNAGALFKIRETIGNEPFLLLNADALFDVDFKKMVEFHKNRDAEATIFTHPNSHPYDSGLIISDSKNCVTQWLAKEDERPEYYKNRVNAGVHIINPSVLDMVEIDESIIGTEVNGHVLKVDLDRDILKPFVKSGKLFCYDSPEYVKDMGTPERYMQVEHDYREGRVEAKNLSKKQRAIFLDRDGTINKYVDFLTDINDFELLDGVAEAIRKINNLGYLCIVVTNQPVIARGELSFKELELIHNKMETVLGKQGAYIDDIFFCPHHPHKGFEGEVEELKIACSCRKPKPGMLYEAAEKYNIDLSTSWMIGDSENDILAGMNAGCKTALITQQNEEYGQDITVKSLLEYVEHYTGVLK